MSVTFRTKPLSRRLALYADCEALLPLEDARDVATLFDELCQELKPIGLLEESQIATIGRLLWRKYHLEIFLLAEQARVESYREQREKMAAASASPAQQALEAASKKRKPLEEDDKWQERLADLADLRNLDLARYLKDLEILELLDAGIERALARLEKYQTWRRTGSLSRPAPKPRAPRWGQVRQ